MYSDPQGSFPSPSWCTEKHFGGMKFADYLRVRGGGEKASGGLTGRDGYLLSLKHLFSEFILFSSFFIKRKIHKRKLRGFWGMKPLDSRHITEKQYN